VKYLILEIYHIQVNTNKYFNYLFNLSINNVTFKGKQNEEVMNLFKNKIIPDIPKNCTNEM